MKIISLVLISLIFLLGACSNSPNSKKSKPNFAHIEPPYDIAQMGLSRIPANSDPVLDYYKAKGEEIVEKMINDVRNDTSKSEQMNQKALGRYLEAVSQIYISSQFFIKKFDMEVASRKQLDSIFQIEAYQELIKNWMIRERIENQILYVLQTLLNKEADQTDPDSTIAARQLNYTRGIWEQIAREVGPNEKIITENKIRRLIFQDLFKEFNTRVTDQIENFKRDNPEIEIPVNFLTTQGIVRNIIMNDKEEKGTLLRLKSEIELKVKEGKSESPWLSLAKQSINLGDELSLDQTDRKPQSINAICPSANAEGNISGSYFPKGTWAMTLDDGPHKSYTKVILKAFTDNGVKGTFFWLGQLTPSYPSIVDMVKVEGNTLATHSYSHANLPTLGSAGLNKEIVVANKMNAEAYGHRPKFFRCPYGACGKAGGTIRKMIADEGEIHVFWNIDSLDWKDKNADSIVNRVLTQYDAISKNSGGVILFHDIHAQSAEAITKLIPLLIKRGAKFDSLENIVATHNDKAEIACPNNWSPRAHE